ncbi:biotin--[acetyl-CoA-carboxylase] ligase [Halobacteriales archaeon SW_10_66_29]|nr:MAG: biotin--[acetyl-CoA-carboxylase] ligase [Halobacteriales archaeon SW_10_66_29]
MQETRARVLDRIAAGPVGGPQIAEDLGISRAAVWKHVEALRAAGFEIDSAEAGYELISIPEFGGPAVEFGLDAPYEVEYHETIDSTNARARDLAVDGRANVVVLADAQTGGRGRLDRGWSSPSGGIWLSILSRPQVPPAQAPAYTLAAAVATTRAVREAGVDASIKWPNDVLVGDRKLAGILTEMEGEADRVSWLVVGIGINANVDAADLPTDRPVTTVREEVGDVDRRELTQSLLAAFHELTVDLQQVLPAWRKLSSTLGQRVRVETPGEEIVGDAVDVRFPGSLVVETAEGTREVTAGDCEHLRPADP